MKSLTIHIHHWHKDGVLTLKIAYYKTHSAFMRYAIPATIPPGALQDHLGLCATYYTEAPSIKGKISISPNTETPAATLVHELAHFLTNAFVYVKRPTRSEAFASLLEELFAITEEWRTSAKDNARAVRTYDYVKPKKVNL